MALLNYSKLASEAILNKIGITSSAPDYAKLYFTGDGHIITHGTDFTQLFSDISTGSYNKDRGLVHPISFTSNSVQSAEPSHKLFLRGTNTWAEITTADLPIFSGSMANLGVGLASKILNSQLIVEYVSSQFAANDAMRFKGGVGTELGASGTTYYYTNSSGKHTGFPNKCEVGDTYRVINTGTYAGLTCSSGDLIICIKDGSGAKLNTSEYWTAVESNINGIVEHTINGAAFRVYSDSNTQHAFYAPITAGTSGWVLKSTGKTPEWVNPNTLIAGGLTEAAQKALLTSVTATNGDITVTVGGHEETARASGTWGISISGQANRVSQALSTGVGLTMSTNTEAATYNGSTARTIKLVPSAGTNIGGIYGDNTTLSTTNAFEGPTVTIDGDGKLHLTKLNILNALGFAPGNSVNNTTYTIDSASAPEKDPIIKLLETSIAGGENATAGQFQLLGNTSIAISRTATVVSFILNKASDSVLGGIKTGYTSTGNNYAVKMDGENAYVNVPWVNTTYGVVSQTVDGLAPKWDTKGTGVISSSHYALVNNGTKVEWLKLPANAFTNTWRSINVSGKELLSTAVTSGALNFVGNGHTSVVGSGNNITISSSWRDIQINGQTIGNQALNILPSEDICFIVDNKDTSDVYELSLGLSWYNIDTKSFETA